MAVEGFPRDSANLMRLSGQTKFHMKEPFHQNDIIIGNALTTLLDVFQFSTDATIESRKKRFREFVGLVIDA